MAGISGIIKLLHSKHGNTFPITTTRAIYSENTGECLDDILKDTILSTDSIEYEGTEPRDADTLGGRYTADSIDGISSKIGNLEELPTTEKGSLVGAVTEVNSQTPKIFRVHWDKTLKITGIRHGLVMISNTAIYLLWVTGPTGSVTLSLTKVFQGTSGASVNATYSEAEDLVTITTSANCAITFIGK